MSNRTREYTLEVYRNKRYHTVHASRKVSQCLKRVESMYNRCRIRLNGETVVHQFAARQ